MDTNFPQNIRWTNETLVDMNERFKFTCIACLTPTIQRWHVTMHWMRNGRFTSALFILLHLEELGCLGYQITFTNTILQVTKWASSPEWWAWRTSNTQWGSLRSKSAFISARGKCAVPNLSKYFRFVLGEGPVEWLEKYSLFEQDHLESRSPSGLHYLNPANYCNSGWQICPSGHWDQSCKGGLNFSFDSWNCWYFGSPYCGQKQLSSQEKFWTPRSYKAKFTEKSFHTHLVHNMPASLARVFQTNAHFPKQWYS